MGAITQAATSIARPFATVGAIVARSAGMLFARGRSWAVLMSRTIIDYRYEVGDPMTNSAVGAVVGWIARNFPDAPVRIVLEADPNAPPIVRSETGPGAMLRLLEKPNPAYSGVLQWYATIVDWMRGDAYWLKKRSPSGRVEELWWVPRQMMEPRWPLDDPTVFIGWYEYTVDGVIYIVKPKDVVHFRNGINPDNVRKGTDLLASLWREIFTDDEASNFTASLLRNLGVPGVIIAPANTTAGGRPIDADTDSIKTKFKDTFGGDRRGEPMVMSAPTEVKVLSWSPEQMNLRELRRIPEERVSAVLGVPAGVAGLGAGLDRNTFTNLAEAKGSAYTEGVIPKHRLIAADLEAQLLPEFVGDPLPYDVYFDSSVVAAMAGVAAAAWKLAESSATKGLIKRSAFKRMTGQPVARDGSDEVYIMPNNYVIIAAPDEGDAPQSDIRVLTPGAQPRPALPPGPPAAMALGDGTRDDIRCSSCGHKIANQATPPFSIQCRHCKAVTTHESPAPAGTPSPAGVAA